MQLLVNLVGYILLYGLLKLKTNVVAKMLCDLSPSVLASVASKSLKLIKHAFYVHQKFEAIPHEIIPKLNRHIVEI